MDKPIQKILSALRTRRHETMLREFRRRYTPFQILVSTVMSARTKDTTTIPIAHRLFNKYKTPKDFVKIPRKVLEKLIYGIGFYRTKAGYIKKLSEIIIKEYGNKVPSEIDQLLTLPGVGRKTANCVLCYAFRKPAIPVDVHVHRISNRIGLVKTKTPEETEMALLKLVPKRYWLDINELFVTHGQTVCAPITPKCSICPITKFCDYYKKECLKEGKCR